MATAAVPVATSATTELGPGLEPVDQQVVPAAVVAEREQLRPAVVVGRDAVEQTQRVALSCRLSCVIPSA